MGYHWYTTTELTGSTETQYDVLYTQSSSRVHPIGTIQYNSMDNSVLKVNVPISEQREKFGKSSNEKGTSDVLGSPRSSVLYSERRDDKLHYLILNLLSFLEKPLTSDCRLIYTGDTVDA